MVTSSRTQARRNELRANLLALSEACPFDHSNPEDCPLFKLRKKKPGERLQWFQALDEDDLVYLATYHHICLTTKVKSRAARCFC
jgi:hypothetical protein